ncbi:MAG: hypothetical protein E6J85_17825 [Deltaproteobacteria bacterium]|nr:MAG: hypothetical protein E6J85_17825 [Deltaproteobacteria bacterium]TMB26616.1 MAG: hypothetical protein E6J61_21565 [Deltaproteobacteria bacterium]
MLLVEPWLALMVLESLVEPIVPEVLFGFVCALPLTPDELMLPLALVSPDFVVPLAVAPLLGLVATVPPVDWVPSTEPCCVVPVLLAVFVSLLELEHAAIRAAAAIAVPT